MKNYSLVSEELSDHFVDIQLDDSYHYIKIGATNVGQLEKSGLIPKKSYGKLKNNKPDGLILFGKNTVKALIEVKPPVGIINSKKSAKSVITNWYYELANKLGCKVIIVTDNDGGNSYWFDNNGNEIKENKTEIRYPVHITYDSLSEEKEGLVSLIKKCDTIDEQGNIVTDTVLDPTKLANRVWQKIWISTGKDPEKCLYNVVEIFIFKFLSDLKVLPEIQSFNQIYGIIKNDKDKELALKTYATTTRKHIKEDMFPKSTIDNTTIFNGTIFVNEQGEANLAQASLFAQILEEFANYEKEYGSFKNIDKSFKTRLYESFLRQSAGVAALGQYFTPRNVVRSIIEMLAPDSIKDDIKVCDPFCGVGGFPLEFINAFTKIKNQFKPKNGIITPMAEIRGFDKGSDEKDDERTIILAKANMLIYLADLIAEHKNYTKEFSTKVFNATFHLIKNNLGTLGIRDKKDYYDLILTNPPYVSSGVSTIKKEIEENGLKSIYPANGNGLEGLAIEWIINALKPDGKAFIIVPDGVFSRSSDKKLRDRIIDMCEINGIVSLPSRTFFATPKRTYILALTKKNTKYKQTTPVFTYLVSEIGETKDVNRFEEPDKNDLISMSKLFRQFMVIQNDFTTNDPRCKIQNISRFEDKDWLVDRDWTPEEKKELGIKDDSIEISETEFHDIIESIKKCLATSSTKIDSIKTDYSEPIDLKDLFDFIKGSAKYTKKYFQSHNGTYPVYSSQTSNNGVIANIDTYDFDTNGKKWLTWTTDGIYAGTVFVRTNRFSMTTHCGLMKPKSDFPENIDIEYLKYILNRILPNYAIGDQNLRVTKEILSNVSIKIPINHKGEFDLEQQNQIAKKYMNLENTKTKLIDILEKIKGVKVKIEDVA